MKTKVLTAILFVMLYTFTNAQSTCADTIPTLIDFQDYQTQPEIKDSGVHVLNNCWTAGKATSHSQVNWRLEYETPSPKTGPVLYIDWNLWWVNRFLYLEASGNSASDYDSASFYSPYIYLDGLLNPHMSFDYHMYGEDMGTLQVDVFDGNLWHYNLWSISGEQHQQEDPFTNADLDLSNFIGDSIIIQFKGIKNGGPKGDMAIDNISIVDELPCKKVVNPYAQNLLPNSAEIHWTDTTSIQFYKIYYGPEGFTPDSASSFIYTSFDSVWIDQFNPGETYDVYIESYCDTISFSNLSGPVRFTTPCGPFRTPYLEDFENIYNINFFGNQDDLPYCWDTVSNSSDIYNGAVYVDGNQWYSNSHALLMASGYTAHSQIIVNTPEIIGLDSLNKRLSFDAFCLSGSGSWFWTPYSQAKLIIGTIGNPKDSSSFHAIDTLLVPFYNYQHFEYYLDSASLYNGVDTRIAFSIQSSFNNPNIQVMFMDNVTIDHIPPCPKPSGLDILGTTPHTADVLVESYGSKFNFQYDTAGFVIGSGIMDSSTSLSHQIIGLNPGSTYDIYVQNNCMPFDSLSEWVGPFKFRTQCISDSVPYFENFSLPANMNGARLNSIQNPTCWTASTNSDENGSTWIVYGGKNGTTGLRIDIGNLNVHDTEMVYSPVLRGLDIGQYQVKFWARNVRHDPYMQIVVGTTSDRNSAAAFNPLDTITVYPSSTQFHEYTVWIDTKNGYNGSDSIVAFQYIKAPQAKDELYIDDVSIDLIDSCAKPMSVYVDSITTHSSWVHWQGIDTGYTIEYGVSGYIYGNGTSIGSNSSPLQLTSLSPGTEYDVYILKNCVSTGGSNLFGPISFTTRCTAKNTPLFENLDNATYGDDAPNCWTYSTSKNASNYGFVKKVTNGHYKSYPNVYHLDPNNSSDSNDIIALISPEIIGMENGNKKIRFYGSSNWSAWPSTIYVATFSNPSNLSTMHVLDTIELAYSKPISNEYVVRIDSISGYNLSDKYVGFVGIPSDNFNVSASVIDDIWIENIPSCSPPYDFIGSILDSNSVELSWKSSMGTSFTIKYGPQGFTGVGTQKNISPMFADTITGLMPNTAYDFYVRDSCNLSWIGPITLRTNCTEALKGVYTVGSIPGPKNFNSLHDALYALETCGVDSSVVIQLASGNYIGNFALHVVPGASSINTITFQGSGNLQTKIMDSTNTAVFSLLESRHIHIDNIAFINKDGTTVATDRIHHVYFNHCSFKMPLSKGAGIDSELTARSSNLSVKNSIFEGGTEVITISDFDTLIIESNEFKYASSWTMHLSRMTYVQVTQNRIEGGGLYAFDMTDAKIEANTILSNGNSMDLIYLNVDTYVNNLVANNMVNGTGTTLSLYNINNTVFIHNSFKSGSDALNAPSNYGNVAFYNNIFYGNRSLYISNYQNISMNYNCLFAASGVLAHLDGEPYYSLSSIQNDYPLDNQFTIIGDPIFVSSTDLHLKGGLANDMGDNLHSMATDIDGDTRPSPFAAHVDIGADEYDLIAVNLATLEVIVTDDLFCEGVPLNIDVAIKNEGVDTLSAANFELIAFGNSQTITKNLNLPPFTSDTIQLGVTANALSGNQVITVIGLATGDTLNNNDTATADLFITPVSTIQITGIADSICQGDSTYYIISPSTTGSFIWVFNNDTIAVSGVNDTVWSKPVISSQSYHVFHQPDPSECKMKDTVINLNPIPMPIAAFSYIAGPPDTTSLTVQYSSNISQYTDSVFWDLGDSTFSSSAVLNHTYNKNGSYTVILYVYNDCGVDSTIKTVVIQGIDITELSASEIKVYPNPNDGTFKLDMGSLNGIYDLSIYDLQGRRIYSEKLDAKKVHSIKLDESKGVYLMTLNNGNSTIHKRVIIQ